MRLVTPGTLTIKPTGEITITGFSFDCEGKPADVAASFALALRWAGGIIMRGRPTVLTKGHPEANGRKPMPGEREYIVTFPLESGEFLTVKLGQKDFDNTTDLLMDMLTGAPSHDDGSIPPHG